MEYHTASWFWLFVLSFLVTELHITCSAKNIAQDYDEASFQGDYMYEEFGAKSDTSHLVDTPERPVVSNQDPKLAPYFLADKSTSQAKENETVVIYCDAKNLRDDNLIMWYNGTNSITQGGIVVGANPRIQILGKNAIQLKNVKSHDSATYRCVVYPENISHNVELKVDAPPKVLILSYSRDVTSRSIPFKEGDKVELDCRAHNLESYNIKWSFKGERVLDGVTDDGKLIIQHVMFDNAGPYQCLADDRSKSPPLGTVVVNVNYTPRILAHHRFVNTIHGDNAELSCEYTASPIATSDWLKGGKPVPRVPTKYFKEERVHNENNKTVLQIKKVDDNDLGAYECELQNQIGTARSKVYLVFEPEPGHFDHQNYDNYSAILTWRVKSKQELLEVEMEYKHNQSDKWNTLTEIPFEKMQDSNDVYLVRHKFSVAPGMWHARVRSRNTAGWSKYSHLHNFKIKEPLEEPQENNEIIATAGIGGHSSSTYSYKSFSTVALTASLLPIMWSICSA